MSPPATGGIAWFLITGGHLDAVEYVGVRWLSAGGLPLWRAWSWCLAGIAAAFVITLAIATVEHWVRQQAPWMRGASDAGVRHK